MSVIPNSDRRAARRSATRAEIVDAAWELVRVDGIAGLSMRDLGDRVGMRAQSVYSYFASKHEIFDAMFRDGFEAFTEHMERAVDAARLHDDPTDPADAAKVAAHAYVEFCASDPARFQLLFQRTIPGFEPSADSYAVSLASYEWMIRQLAAAGVTGPDAADLWTATLSGLASQQIANDPGGTRWIALIDRAVDMLLAETAADLDGTPPLPDSRSESEQP
jgi:AcrR family transcriptional regulator